MGLSSGIVIAIKYLIPEKTVVNVKKQRIKGNENRMNVDVPITGDVPKSKLKLKLEARKQALVVKRNAKKEAKAAKKLEKTL